jgi:hypothetical protein
LTPTDDLDVRIVALVRRWGRRGINEATVWTVLRSEVPGLAVDECVTAVNRLVDGGRLYRHHRRTRTMIQVAEQTVEPAAGFGDDLFASLPAPD